MSCPARRLPPHEPFRAGHGPHAVPVIADRGDDAWVVLVHFPRTPRIGDRFTFDHTAWQVVREGDHTRGYVAQPAPRPTPGSSA